MIRPPARFGVADLTKFALAVAQDVEDSEPASYKKAITSLEKDKWLAVMAEEYESLQRNKTWILVKKPTDKRVVDCKWIFKKKEGITAQEPVRFKARLVAKGYTQEKCVNFPEVFSPVVKHTSIRILMALVAHMHWEMEQLDVKTTFLHGDLDEDIYMSQLEGFKEPKSEELVCLLKKSL